jgi:hypothetical protein
MKFLSRMPDPRLANPRLARLAPLLLLAACGGHMRMPGPTGHLGREPTTYAERVARSAPAPKEAPRAAEPRRPRRGREGGDAVADAAGELVGETTLTAQGERYRYDCSGFVEAAYARAGLPTKGSSKDLYERAEAAGVLHHKKVGQPGDVVFFDDTFDRNRNGRRDDPLTHVAIVEKVQEDGTMGLVHLGGQGVVRVAMNLKHPHDRTNEAGEIINSNLRSPRERGGGPTLSSELFVAFGSLWAIEDAGALAAAELAGCVLQAADEGA